MLTPEGIEELLRRVSNRILESSEIAYLCSEYTGHNNKPVTPELMSKYIRSCTLRQTQNGEYEIVAPNGDNVRFMVLCARPITEILNDEMEDTVSEIHFLYKRDIPVE